MNKKQRIRELEREVAELRQRVMALETRPQWVYTNGGMDTSGRKPWEDGT